MAIAYGKFILEDEVHPAPTTGLDLKQFIHDIRSPLSAINVCISQMEKNKSGQDTLELMKLAYAHIVEMTATQKTEKTSTTEESFDLSQIIQSVAQEKKALFQGNIKLSRRMTSQLASTQLKPIELKRILSNLINNSIEASATQVQIRLRSMGKRYGVFIRDNGSGIHPEHLNIIGQKHFSFGPKPQGAGQGLGLKSAADTLQKIGGKLKIKSRLNKGTLVYLEVF